MNDNEQKNSEQHGKPLTKLGLSPVTYGLGESVKTGFMGLVGGGIAATLIAHYFKEAPGVKIIAKIPERIAGFFKKKGDIGKDWGNAIATGFGVGTVVSYVTHIPGLISGTKKVKDKEKLVEAQGRENIRLQDANQVLAEDNARLNEALAQVKRPEPSAEPIAATQGR